MAKRHREPEMAKIQTLHDDFYIKIPGYSYGTEAFRESCFLNPLRQFKKNHHSPLPNRFHALFFEMFTSPLSAGKSSKV